MLDQPTRLRLPPYSGAPYIPSQACSYTSRVKSRCAPHPADLLLGGTVAEVGAECGQAGPVALLQADDRAVEFTLGQTERTLDPGAPGQFVERREREEPTESGRAAETTR